MVSANPLFAGGWTLKKFNATVINDIWPEVAFFTLVATMVYLVSTLTVHSLAISTSLLTVLGTVLGLVISFRTSSAYERYQDGRKMWTNITIASRNLAQMIWIHIPHDRSTNDKFKGRTTLQNVIEKKSMVNLVQAFSVSVKHFLRAEPGVYYQDLFPLIAFLPRHATQSSSVYTEADMLPLWRASEDGEYPYDHAQHSQLDNRQHDEALAGRANARKPQRASSMPMPSLHGISPSLDEPDDNSNSEKSWFRSFSFSRSNTNTFQKEKYRFDPEKALPEVTSHRPLKPARNPPEATLYDYFPILRIFKWIFRHLKRQAKPTPKAGSRNAFGRKRKIALVDSNVPLEITMYLSSYLAFCLKSGLLQPALATGIMNNISSLQDTLSNLERIRSTPLPFAYQAHLRMSLWIYLFFLPFQLFETFKYLVIPGTAFASFLLLGFLEIGQEIENPFNYDANDLDLDNFCLSIQRDLHEITAHTSPDPASYIFSGWNQPFAPGDRRTAEDLTRGAQEYQPYPESGDTGSGMPSLRRTLLRGWNDVDNITRQ